MNADGLFADILAEPETLAGVLEAYEGAGSPLEALGADPLSGRHVVLIGMGSSRFAAINVAGALRARGIAAVAEYASTDVPTAPGADVVAVGISASGSSGETIEALARHQGISRTVAVTNRPDGPLGQAADAVLPLLAGQERGGVACRTFQATLAVLLRLAGAPTRFLAPAPDAQAALLDARGAWLEELLVRLQDAHTVYTIAPAARQASALQSALMFREGPRVPADSAETGDWGHVDVYLSRRPGYRALLFGGSRYDPAVLAWALPRNATIVAIGREIDGATWRIPFPHAEDPLVSSLVETSVAELAAAEWWHRREAAGEMPPETGVGLPG